MNKNNEYHVASFVIQAIPTKVTTLTDYINQQAGMEVHACSPEGKIVFTVEAPTQHAIAHQTDQIKQHPDILTLSPVYHQFITEEQEAHKVVL